MRISVRVKANANESKVHKIADVEYAVWVKAPAKEGKANEAVIKALSKYLGIAKSRIVIAKGHKGKNKIINIS